MMVMVVMIVVVVVVLTCAGYGRSDDRQSEKSCENIGE